MTVVASSATDAAAAFQADLGGGVVPQVPVDPTRRQDEGDHDDAEQDLQSATHLPESMRRACEPLASKP